jgi:voltage-gated potassium channel
VERPAREEGRDLAGVATGKTKTHAVLRGRLTLLLFTTVILDAVATVLIYFFERNADRTEIHTIGDSLFWTSTQLLTVSSQLHNPISTPGRVLDVFLQAYAISIVAFLAGSFAAFFHRRGMERDPPQISG